MRKIITLVLLLITPWVHSEVQAPIPTCGYHLVSLAAQHEQYRLFAYLPTPHDRPTVGFGATYHLDGSRVKLGDSLPLGQASLLLHNRLKDVSSQVWVLTGRKLNNSQLAAVTLFADNIGIGAFTRSSLRTHLMNGDYDKASAEFPKWSKQNGTVLKGLLTRRLAEQELFNRPPLNCKEKT